MTLLVISCSLNPESNSRTLAREAQRVLLAGGLAVNFLDLRDLPLPMCDGDVAYDHENVAQAAALIREADGILLATPVYNYDASAAAKNLVELTGQAWENKGGVRLRRGWRRQLHAHHGAREQPDARLPLRHRAAFRLCHGPGFCGRLHHGAANRRAHGRAGRHPGAAGRPLGGNKPPAAAGHRAMAVVGPICTALPDRTG